MRVICSLPKATYLEIAARDKVQSFAVETYHAGLTSDVKMNAGRVPFQSVRL